MSNSDSSNKQKQKLSKKYILRRIKELLSYHSKYVVSAGIIVVALSIAGFNVHAKNNPEALNDSSILLGLLTNEEDYIETVYSNYDRKSNDSKNERFDMLSVASASSNAPAAMSASGANAASGAIDQLALIGENTLMKNSPTGTDISYKPRKEAFTYIVRDGDTISSIAKKFGIDAATILTESNKYADDIIKAGDELTILPVSGATERVDEGQTLSGIAKKHGVDIEVIMKFNELVNATDIEVGQILIIPDGKREIQERPQPDIEPDRTQLAYNDTTSSSRTSYSTPTVNRGPSVGNRFSWGWCTWYAAERRGDVTWRGNAGQWLNNAAAQGRATGRIPAVGSIMVTSESWWGHVAIVESVNGNSVTVSEMNYRGFGVVSSRTISNNSPVIKGYIY